MSRTSRRPRRLGIPRPGLRWESADPAPPETVRALAEALRLPRPVVEVLAARGLTDPEDAKRFLRPRLDDLHDAATLADAPRAADRIADAVRGGETILVHGDYDVDGIASTALLTRFLRGLGARVHPFVPHRLRDGYDFGPAGVRAAAEVGASLIVTADCGTTAVGAVARARAEGRDVVVTDHHTVGDAVAPATALVNPSRPDCAYAGEGLCGAGVAYKVVELVAARLGAPAEAVRRHLDLVALATVADLVPLRGENRVLVHYGLRRMAWTETPGLAALLEVAGVEPEGVDAGAVGYRLGPRINAAGRMGDAADALELLLTDDPERARALAADLDRLNRVRQDEEARTLDEALGLLEGSFDPERDYGVVLAGRGWHAGVIGIVASRVVEHIHRPVVIVALDGERGRGSARSIPGFHLYDALVACASHLERFGGHRQAAGMDVREERLDAFRAAFADEARRRLDGADLRPRARSDADIDLGETDLELVRWLEYLGPHGIGNPRPVFLARDVTVTSARIVGTDHLKLSLRSASGRTVDGIGFGLAARVEPASVVGKRCAALVRLERNTWRGETRLQARVVDLRPVGANGPAERAL